MSYNSYIKEKCSQSLIANNIEFTKIKNNFANQLSIWFSQHLNNLLDFLLRKYDITIHTKKSQKGASTFLFIFFLYRLLSPTQYKRLKHIRTGTRIDLLQTEQSWT